MTWFGWALVSALFAAVTAILAKVGVAGVPPNLATAVRTAVVFVFAWAVVVGQGEHRALGAIDRRSLLFLVLSGVATGLSWLAYFRALALGPASRVAPVDKLSVALTMVLAVAILGERPSWRVALGGLLITAGVVLTALR